LLPPLLLRSLLLKVVKDLLELILEQFPLLLDLLGRLPLLILLFDLLAVRAVVVLDPVLLLEGVLAYGGGVEDVGGVSSTPVHNLLGE